MLTDTTHSPNAGVRGLPYRAVKWTGGLYKERFDTCTTSTVPHLQRMFESRDISHVVENFKIAAGEESGSFDGTVFGDGDFYKWMEAAVYTAVSSDNQELLRQLEDYIGLIGRAQLPDGYISTKQIISEREGTGARLGDINEFEVYNFGHLFTSACLYKRLTGNDSFLKIAEKAAGYLKHLYEEAEKTGEAQTAVCPSHYMGLAELYRTTGNREYLELLKKAVELRDCVGEGMDDNQDRLPLKKHEAIIGHAVRANYLYAGVADLCLEEEKPELKEVLHKVWKNLVTQKLYITGGCGALYNGASPYGDFFHHQLVHQAYGYEYQLPNVTAYNETCASVGGVYWAYRMFCMEKKAEYVDILERMVLNVNLAAVSLDGKRFFYENMLRRAKQLPYSLIWGQERAEYILSYCCPPNLARMIAQLSEYAYAMDDTGIYTLLYGDNQAEIAVPGGLEAVLVQKTAYPYDGNIRFTFENIKNNVPVTLHVRIPGWVRCGVIRQTTVDENDGTDSCGIMGSRGGIGDCGTTGGHGNIVPAKTWNLTAENAGTYLAIPIDNPADTCLDIDFGMEARLTCAHPLVEETVGQVAVERGPLVYCLEGMDAPVDTLDDIYIPSNVRLEPEQMEIEGRTIIGLTGIMLKKRYNETYDRNALYQDYQEEGYEEVTVHLVPYFAWDNRGRDEMRIWMPVART